MDRGPTGSGPAPVAQVLFSFTRSPPRRLDGSGGVSCALGGPGHCVLCAVVGPVLLQALLEVDGRRARGVKRPQTASPEPATVPEYAVLANFTCGSGWRRGASVSGSEPSAVGRAEHTTWRSSVRRSNCFASNEVAERVLLMCEVAHLSSATEPQRFQWRRLT